MYDKQSQDNHVRSHTLPSAHYTSNLATIILFDFALLNDFTLLIIPFTKPAS